MPKLTKKASTMLTRLGAKTDTPPDEILWRTRDGFVIPISQMTDSHLINAIAFVVRTIPQYEQEYEAAKRYTAGITLRIIKERVIYIATALKAMSEEADKRGLSGNPVINHLNWSIES